MSDDNNSNFEFNPDEVSAPDVVAAPQGFFERLKNSFGAIFFGLVLIPLSCWGLFWNEGSAVRMARALDEGLGVVVSVPTDKVEAGNNGKLVHVVGTVTSAAGVADPEFGVRAKGLKLERKVEMYQWVETESGSGQDRKFTYNREWKTSAVNSSRFHAPNGHQNPAFPAFRSTEFGAQDAAIGRFPVGSKAMRLLHNSENYAIDGSGLAAVQRSVGQRVQMSNGAYYIGAAPNSPRVGDIRISYSLVREGPYAFAGRQEPTGLESYRAKNGTEFLLAEPGAMSAEAIFAKAQDDNRILTWIFRGIGLLVLFIGFSALFAPVELLSSYVPILGSLVSGGITLLAAIATALVGPTVIAIAWFYYRPILSLVIIAVGVGIAFGLRALKQKRAQMQAGLQPAR